MAAPARRRRSSCRRSRLRAGSLARRRGRAGRTRRGTNRHRTNVGGKKAYVLETIATRSRSSPCLSFSPSSSELFSRWPLGGRRRERGQDARKEAGSSFFFFFCF